MILLSVELIDQATDPLDLEENVVLSNLQQVAPEFDIDTNTR
jgi:hypothetical protein